MTTYANYLPDEILLEVIAYIEAWDARSKQATLARFCAVNRYALLPWSQSHADRFSDNGTTLQSSLYTTPPSLQGAPTISSCAQSAPRSSHISSTKRSPVLSASSTSRISSTKAQSRPPRAYLAARKRACRSSSPRRPALQ